MINAMNKTFWRTVYNKDNFPSLDKKWEESIINVWKETVDEEKMKPFADRIISLLSKGNEGEKEENEYKELYAQYDQLELREKAGVFIHLLKEHDNKEYCDVVELYIFAIPLLRLYPTTFFYKGYGTSSFFAGQLDQIDDLISEKQYEPALHRAQILSEMGYSKADRRKKEISDIFYEQKRIQEETQKKKEEELRKRAEEKAKRIDNQRKMYAAALEKSEELIEKTKTKIFGSEEQLHNLKNDNKLVIKRGLMVKNGAKIFCFLFYALVIASLTFLRLYSNNDSVVQFLKTIRFPLLQTFDFYIIWYFGLGLVLFYIVWRILHLNRLFYMSDYKKYRDLVQQEEALEKTLKQETKNLSSYEDEQSWLIRKKELLEIYNAQGNTQKVREFVTELKELLQIRRNCALSTEMYDDIYPYVQALYEIGHGEARKYEAIVLWCEESVYLVPEERRTYCRNRALQLGYPRPVANGFAIECTPVRSTTADTGKYYGVSNTDGDRLGLITKKEHEEIDDASTIDPTDG